MAENAGKGNCFLCGETLSKSGFKKHILAAHTSSEAGAQECVLLKVESLDSKLYWLFLDIPVSSTLKTLDAFLREIWVECCGHMSLFFSKGYEELGKSTPLGALPKGFSMRYEYDMGSTTELKITVLERVLRPKQRKAVRLIARNEPPRFACRECGEEADYICCECMWENEYPFLCEACMGSHEHESALPVVNSPRMGVCGYFGEYDEYEFDPEKLEHK